MPPEPLTPEDILRATEDVLRRYGPAKATVVDVARALGVSHGTVYRHFRTKAELREAVTRRWLDRATGELAAIADPEARRQHYEQLVAQHYEAGKAIQRSTTFGIDDTIDPAETRHWIATLLASIRPPAPRAGKKRPMIDAW